MAMITATPAPGAPAANFTGTWVNSGPNMVLTQNGDQVTGTWGDKTMTGTVTGNVVNGRYYKTSCPALFLDYNLTMNADGKSFSGWHTLHGGKAFTGKKK